MRKKVLILGLCLLGVTHSLSSKDKKSIPLYKDAKAPIEKRIDDIISRMTLELWHPNTKEYSFYLLTKENV